MNVFQTLYLTHFSTPKEERLLYRFVKKTKPRIILECGIQRGVRMMNLLRLVGTYGKTESEEGPLYVCTDPFEGRTEEDGPGLSLRKTHKLLSQTGVRHRCIPASVEMGITQISRSIKDIDLAILATPHFDWLATKGALLAVALREDAAVFTKFPGQELKRVRLPEFRRMIDTAVESDRKRRKAA
ncbi:MAG TPA: hypothetical protein DEB39_16340 [Planctomycetaceae bacterium]|nr:hypothetical protein [Planctomycetaceae bacterium]